MEQIYRSHFGFVWATLRRLGVVERDADDVAQEVFVVVHRRHSEFEGRSSVRTWLYGITVRVAWNHIRRQRYRRTVELDPGGSESICSESFDPEATSTRRQANRLLHELLQRLDEHKRTVFVLAEVEGLTAPEISVIVGVNSRTVCSRLYAARAQFYAGLAKHHAPAQAPQRWLAHAVKDDRPSHQARHRVWAALLVQLPALRPATVAVATTGLNAYAVVLAVAMGVTTLGIIRLASSAAPSSAAPSSPAPSSPGPSSPSLAVAPPVDVPSVTPGPPASVHSASVRPPAAPPPAHVSPTSGSPVSPSDTRRTAARKPASEAPDDPLAAELALLEEARRALRAHDAAGALRFVQTHGRRFPHSHLTRQRDKTLLSALCALGRYVEADALAGQLGEPGGCR